MSTPEPQSEIAQLRREIANLYSLVIMLTENLDGLASITHPLIGGPTSDFSAKIRAAAEDRIQRLDGPRA